MVSRRAGDEAVDGERRQPVGLEEAHEEAHREIGGDGGAERAHERRAAHAVALEPNSSGSLSTAAAPMIGVASRNAKRAASSLESPASRPPPIVAPEREKPGSSASACAAPIADRLAPARAARRSARRRRAAGSGPGARRRSRSAPSSISAVEHQEDGGRLRRGEHLAQRVLEQQAEQPGGDRADDEQPAELGVGVVGRDLAVAQRAPEAARRSAPSRARRSRAGRARSPGASRPGRSGSSRRSGGCPSRAAAGRTTLWPRLEIGNSSATPWTRPRTIACT